MSNLENFENSMNDQPEKEIDGDLANEAISVNPVSVQKVSTAKKRPDPITIAFAVLALAVIVGFGVYFIIYIKNNASLKMTLRDFSTVYQKSDGYMVISSLGFSFPECKISDSDPDGKTSLNERYFSGEVITMLDCQINVSGSINKSNDYIKRIQVSVVIPAGGNVAEIQSDSCYYFMPFIQTLYPEMATEDTVTFSQDLFATQKPVIRGDYSVSAKVDEAAGFIYLFISPK